MHIGIACIRLVRCHFPIVVTCISASKAQGSNLPLHFWLVLEEGNMIPQGASRLTGIQQRVLL